MSPYLGDIIRPGSIFGSRKGDVDEGGDILEAIERAKGFKVCPRRIWAVSSGLPGGARSLPSLIPAADMYSVPSQKRQHHEHEQCTFDFCEHSQLDFTLVEQHHEDCEKEGNCSKFHFPLEQLDHRIKTESATAWRLVLGGSGDAPSLIDSKQPYMAISHVWADGTGAGIWGPGRVNSCLYRFFCDLARSFQCEGCWWDTISIPRTNKLRNEALNIMHDNYAQARVTLVHDLYLREWEWVDAETACFAIVMSPWYSRGWTALELAKSRKVHILFKASNGGSSIKDLDVDILDKVPFRSRHHATAEAIRTLRRAKIENLEDLSSILNPRDTSKLRDIPIISGLLAGVDVSGGSSQQEIYQRILRKLGKVAQGHLFHNSAATMAAPGFSWCPTNIFDMPRTEIISKSEWLEVQENGDLEGTWKVYPTDSINDSDFVWHGTHALTRAYLKSALGEGKRNRHLLLAEVAPAKCTRALLVQPMHGEGQPENIFYCRLVGPVYFHRALGSGQDGSNNQDLEGRVLKTRITNNDKMRHLDGEAWRFVCDIFDEHETSKGSEATPTDPARATSTSDDDDFGRQEMRALLFLRINTSATNEQLFHDKSKILPTSQSELTNDMVMYCAQDDDKKSSTLIKAFFYGHEHFVGKIKDWLADSITDIEEAAKAEEAVKTRSLMHISSDKNRKIQVDSTELSAKELLLETKALRLAVENEREDLAAPLVSFLLENGVRHVPIYKGIAGEDGNEAQSIIHLAAKKGFLAIANEIVKYMKEDDLNEQDRDGCTALLVATENGHSEIVRLLLNKGAATGVRDKKQNIALHYAALHADVGCVVALLSHAEAQCQEEEPMSLASSRAGDEGTNGDTENESSFDADSDDDSDSYKPLGKCSTKQIHPRFSQKANLEVTNDEKRTALQLASHKGNSKVVKLLIQHGAKTYVSDSPDQTALALAAQHGRVEVVKILLEDQPDEAQPDQDQPDQDQPDEAQPDEAQPDEAQPDEAQPDQDHSHKSQTDKSQLLSAIEELSFSEERASSEQVIKSRTKKSQPHMWKQCELDAALLAAIKELSSGEDKASLEQVIECLLAHGAKPGPSDADGMTALHWAIKVKHEPIAESLVKPMVPGDETLEKKKQQRATVRPCDGGRFSTIWYCLHVAE